MDLIGTLVTPQTLKVFCFFAEEIGSSEKVSRLFLKAISKVVFILKKVDLRLDKLYSQMLNENKFKRSPFFTEFVLFFGALLTIPEGFHVIVKLHHSKNLEDAFKNTFLRYLDGYTNSFRIARKIKLHTIRKTDLFKHLNNYPNYALNQIFGWSHPVGHMTLRRGRILGLLKRNREGILLDAGCGVNPLIADYHAYGFSAIGLDLSLNALKAGNFFSPLNKGKLVFAELENLPFKSDSFDVVVASEVIEHLLFPEEGIKEIHRILKHSGIAVFSVPTDTSARIKGPKKDRWIQEELRSPRARLLNLGIDEISQVIDYADFTHITSFTAYDFCHLLQTSGFIIKRTVSNPYVIVEAQKASSLM